MFQIPVDAKTLKRSPQKPPVHRVAPIGKLWAWVCWLLRVSVSPCACMAMVHPVKRNAQSVFFIYLFFVSLNIYFIFKTDKGLFCRQTNIKELITKSLTNSP